jgi:hypothetical protein
MRVSKARKEALKSCLTDNKEEKMGTVRVT